MVRTPNEIGVAVKDGIVTLTGWVDSYSKKWAAEETKAKPDVIDKAYDQLSKGGIWAVNDGMPEKLLNATVDGEVETGVVKAQNKPTYAIREIRETAAPLFAADKYGQG